MSIYTPEFFVGRGETVNASAAVVAPIVKKLLAPMSLLDVGCGQGEWMKAFSLPTMVGVDIAAPEGEQFIQHDLTVPLDLGRTFDLVLCLEVGEHLPEESAETLVATIVWHSDQILFSAAVPWQEGKGHVNCQPHEYWHEIFVDYGFVTYDAIRPQIAGDSRVSWWYAQNIFLYSR